MAGHFFVVEGLDFTGKSSLVKHCEEGLKKLYGEQVVAYRAPGGTPLGEKVRDIARIEAKSPLEQTYAYLLSLTSLREQIQKDLSENKIVIVDRWFQSLYCYQIMNLSMNSNKKSLEDICFASACFPYRKPPNYILLDVSFEIMEERLKASSRPDTTDRFEASGVDYRKGIHRNYKELFRNMHQGLGFGTYNQMFDTDLLTMEKIQQMTLGEMITEIESR